MRKFTNSFSSEDFDIIRNVASKLGIQQGEDELRARIIELAKELQPERPLSDAMVDALVKLCSKPDDKYTVGLSPGPDKLVSR